MVRFMVQSFRVEGFSYSGAQAAPQFKHKRNRERVEGLGFKVSGFIGFRVLGFGV